MWDKLKPQYTEFYQKKAKTEQNSRGANLPTVFSGKQAENVCAEENTRAQLKNKRKEDNVELCSAKLAKTYHDGKNYELIHRRNCHIEGKGKHLPPGMKKPEGGIWCEGCVQGKMRAKSFKARKPNDEKKTRYKIGGKWHADWKDFKIKSNSGMTGRFLHVEQELGYWISIFAKSSEEATDAAEEVRLWVLENTDARMRALHMDNGSYFTGTDLGEWAKEYNIKLSFSAKDCPQQNPFVERATQTIDDLIIANMAGDHGDFPKAPPRFWAEACKAIETVHNSLRELPGEDGEMVSRAGVLQAPEWQPEHFRTLFCEAWFYRIKKKRRGALTTKAKPGVFVGYAQKRKAYRIWDLEKHKMREIAIQHVVTYENNFPFQDKDNWRAEWLQDTHTLFLFEDEEEEVEPELIERNNGGERLRRNPAPSLEGLESIASQAEN